MLPVDAYSLLAGAHSLLGGAHAAFIGSLGKGGFWPQKSGGGGGLTVNTVNKLTKMHMPQNSLKAIVHSQGKYLGALGVQSNPKAPPIATRRGRL